MQRLLIVVTLLVLAVGSVSAQSAADRPHRAERAKMAEELGLSPEQQSQLKAIRQDAKAKLEALRTDGGSRPDPEAVRAIRATARKASQAVLTPEQRRLVEQRQAEREQRKQMAKAELRQHKREKVKPVLHAARARFDDELAPADREAIDRLREVFANRPRPEAPKGELTAEERRAAKERAEAWRAEHTDELAQLNALAEKYAAEIDRVFAALEPSQREWQEERRSIIRGEKKPRREAKRDKRRGDKPDKAGRELARQRFLLIKA